MSLSNRFDVRQRNHEHQRQRNLKNLKLEEGVFHGIQAKNCGPSSTITASTLGTFQSVVMNRLVLKETRAKGYLYYIAGEVMKMHRVLYVGHEVINMKPSTTSSFDYTQNNPDVVLCVVER